MIDYNKLFNVDKFSLETDISGKYFKPEIKSGIFIWNGPLYREYPLSIAKWEINGKRYSIIVEHQPKEDLLEYLTKAIEFSRKGIAHGN